jgi:hypothetical protein
MFVNRFKSCYLFSGCSRMVHEIIIQSVRGGTPAIAGWGGEVLRNPPRFIAEIALEAPNSFGLAVSRVGFHGQNILAQPGKKLWVDLRADILARGVFGGCFKFPFEFGVPAGIEF